MMITRIMTEAAEPMPASRNETKPLLIVDGHGGHVSLASHHDIKDVEDAQRVQGTEDKCHQQCRHDQRKREREELADFGCPIDRRSLVQIAGNQSEAGEQKERHKRSRLPDVDRNDHRQRCCRGRQKCDLLRYEMQIDQKDIDHSVDVVEHPGPDLG